MNKPFLCILTAALIALTSCTPPAPDLPTAAPPKTTKASATGAPLSTTITPPPTTADLTAGATRTSDKDGMVEVFVPAGEFLMGSQDADADADVDEKPQHKLSLEAFWIDKFEVANQQYAQCVQTAACDEPKTVKSSTKAIYYGDAQFKDYPVIQVTWKQAKAYCEWAGRRLPSEAEWEKAARGSDGRKYPWGDQGVDATRANFCDKNCSEDWKANKDVDDGYADTSPVGTYPKGASPYGALDMAGNVWEWTSSQYEPYPYVPGDGRENPNLTGGSDTRTLRGSSWSGTARLIRATSRSGFDPAQWSDSTGIRCAATP